MRKRIYPLILLAGLLLGACRQEEGPAAPPVPEPSGTEAVDSETLVPGEMIVEFSEEMTALLEADLGEGAFLNTRSAAVNSILGEIGAVKVERLYPDAGEWEPRHRKAGLHRWYVVTFDPELPQTRAVRDISAVSGVDFAEPVRQRKSTAVFNDPYLYRQWHYYNDGTYGTKHKAGCDINVIPVWENFTAGRSDVIVAVIDGGVDLEHEDIGPVTIPAGNDGSRNFVDNSFRIIAHSHGTHVAGTIGAINNNGTGVCGIAGGNNGKGGVKILSCQVFKEGEDGKDIGAGFANALVWAADHGAVIANNSWGDVYKSEEDALNGGVGHMKSSIDYFITHAGTDSNGNQTGPMKGGLVVFAAGNEGWKMGWPAAYEAVVAVGAVAPDYTRATYSNYGDWVDIAAPGGDQTYDNGNVLSTTPGNTYSSYQGTSMACPHVAGIAALIVSQFGGQGFTADMLKARLLGGARQGALSKATQIGPLADVLGSFSYGGTKPPEAVKSHSVSSHSNFVDFSWKAVKDPDDVVAYGYLLLACEDRATLQNLDARNMPANVFYASVEGNLKSGTAMEGTLPGLGFNTHYYTSVVAYDYAMNYSPVSSIQEVTTQGNNPPVISISSTGKVSLRAHESFSADVLVSDPDGHAVSLAFEPGSNGATLQNTEENKYRLFISGKEPEAGNYAAVFTLTDAFGAVTEQKLDYEILPNHAPEPNGSMDNLMFESIGVQAVLQMADYISDPDGERLVYIIDTNPVGIVHLNQVDDVLNLTTLSYGLANVTITGTDVKGEKATIDLKVLVRDPSSAPDVYPTQVKDYLTVSDGSEKALTIMISNAAGAVLYKETVTCDAFSPASIDMRAWAPGRYAVKVESEGKSFSYNIVKI